jgi:membrane glycosyltransferase
VDDREGGAHSYFVLSDTNNPAVAAAEEKAIEAWRPSIPTASASSIAAAPRTKFKAGNVRDFCERWGSGFADAAARRRQPDGGSRDRAHDPHDAGHPKIGILQSLVIGMPSSSGFARIFQFGMRHGMRSYTMGQAWWVGDCGPFWGHNALVRIKPFLRSASAMPNKPPLGSHVMSHDQVERH